MLFAGCRAEQDRTSPEVTGSEPGYVQLHKSGELAERAEKMWEIMRSCNLCPRKCGVNRLEGEEGFCQADSDLVISSYFPHYGEEKPLTGTGGSGAIFFSNCALRCVFCINWQVSIGGKGDVHSIEDLADMMLQLQRLGTHNINVVTPSHYSAHILMALDKAAERGLNIPLVYNTCGWERLEILKLLDGVVDIYLPDMKYSEGEMAAKYSAGAKCYPETTKEAILEMHRQVGVAKPDEDGLVRRGLMVRHLVLPNDVSGSLEVIEWIAENLPKDTYLNIMSQYRPMHRAHEFPDISRRLTREEYREVVERAKELGLTNLDLQGY